MDVAKSKVLDAMEYALDDFCNRMQSHIDRGICTEDEVLIALGGYPDFQDNWIDWMKNND